jgi:hypothetical protein
MGKSFKKTERETQRERERATGSTQGDLFSASLQQGVSPSKSIQKGSRDSWLQLRQTLAGLTLDGTDLNGVPLWSPEMLQARGKGPCLH